MTALLSLRSAWLLVGSTPVWLANVRGAGDAFKTLRAMPRQRLLPARFWAKERTIGLYCRRSERTVRCRSRRSWVWAKTSQAQKTRSHRARLASELPLAGQALGVRGEVPAQVSPVDLTSGKRQVRIGPPAVGGDDRLSVTERLLGVILVATWLDLKVDMSVIEQPPHRAPLTGGTPAGLA